MRVFATMFVLFASLSLAGCGQSGDPEINKLLDNFESLVSDFEKMANQDKVCFSEIGEIMP
ncbi:MAG: lipoprotein, partial [Candidatus Puniceispirillales bacterium]